MTKPSSASSALCCSNRMMNGPSSARYMTLETIAPLSDDPLINLPAVAR